MAEMKHDIGRTILGHVALIGAIFASAWASPGFAAETVTQIGISANVTNNCHISVAPLQFDNVDVIGPEADDVSTGTVSVTCTNGAAWSIGVDAGTAPGATFATRKMTDPATGLGFDYALYTSTARTAIWGDGVAASTATLEGVGTGSVQTRSFSGQILAGQETLPAGSYSEAILLTVTY
jgi:spore coat protein U-like protein